MTTSPRTFFSSFRSPSLQTLPPIAGNRDRSPLLDSTSPSGALDRDWALSGTSFNGLPNLQLNETPEFYGVRDSSNLATLAVPAMGTALDALSAPPLNVRRPAAPTLPSFELPPPPFTLAAAPKYAQPSHPPVSHPPANVSVGNLLTPPATNQPEHATPQPLAPSTGASSDLPPAYWSGANPYGQTWGSGVNTVYPARSSFSPSSGMQIRPSITSPPTTDGLSHAYEAPSLSYQALPAPSTLAPSGQQPMAMYPGGPATSPAPLSSNDPYASKHQHMYAASPSMASPHQTGFSPMYGPAGLGIHPPGRISAHSPTGGQPPLSYPRQPWPSYSLPAMNGPVMTNVHSPGGPMSMMGMQPGLLPGFNSGHVASSQHLYGAHPPPHGMSAPAADRPFKCDQCPQSFNRNHDLKRHKRIHLAVKPFPCSHCDKSFSRKDALKVCSSTCL